MTKVPSVDETRSLILASKSEDWLKKQLQAKEKMYGKGNLPDDLLHWTIAQQAGLEVAAIKANDDGGEGEEVVIFRMDAMIRDEEDKTRKAFTHVSSKGFDSPKDQGQYKLPGVVVLSLTEGETSKKTDKLDVLVSDGTGTVKVVSYGKACELWTEAKIRPGDTVSLPLLNGQWGSYKNRNTNESETWWKFQLPPFGSVRKIEESPTTFLKNLDQVPCKAKDGVFVDGLVTALDEREQEVCVKCDQWWMDNEDDVEKHADCLDDDGEVDTRIQTTWNGTIATPQGQIHKLFFAEGYGQPKVKVGQDLVRILGVLTTRATVNVSCLLKTTPDDVSAALVEDEDTPVIEGSDDPEEEVTPPEDDPEPEEEDEEEPAPKPKKRRRKKATPVPEPEPEPKKTTKKVAKKVAKKTASKEPVGSAHVIDFITSVLEKNGSTQRTFVLARAAAREGLIEVANMRSAAEVKAAFRPHVEAGIKSGTLVWADDKEATITLPSEEEE